MRRASSGIPSLFTNGNTAAFSGAIAGCKRNTTRFSPSTSSSWYASTITTSVVRSAPADVRSEEHTSELQSQFHLVCRLLLEKKKQKKNKQPQIIQAQTTNLFHSLLKTQR